MSAIYRRELKAYFISPIGYVFSAVFFAISGILFTNFTLGAQTTDTTGYFMWILVFFVILIPLLTMKLFSDEKKSGTEQLLLTSPVSLVGIVFAKFLAAYTLFAGTFAASAILNKWVLTDIAQQQKELQSIEKMNSSVFWGCFAGVLLIGSAFIAIGVFVSSLTENQIIAAVVSIGVFALMIACAFFSVKIENLVLRVVVKWFSVLDRFMNFSSGVLDFTAIVYYLSITTIFLFLTVRVYEKRRWE